MILNFLVIACVLGITGAWSMSGKGRGAFSSFLAAVCVVLAGAVAFGVWELVVYALLLGLHEDLAWALGLAVPFALTLLVLRLASDSLVSKNLDLPNAANFAGGAVFGLVSAVITTGIIVISLMYLRGGPTVFGHQAIKDDKGNLVYEQSLWVPVDRLTVALYDHLSLGAFGTSTSLATRMPRLHEQAAMQRMVYFREGDKGNSVGRNSIGPDDLEVKGRYQLSGLTVNELRADSLDNAPQPVTYPDGSSPAGGSTVEGFVVQFKSGAKEKKSGQVVIGAGQVRLVGEADGEPFAVHPFAVVAQPDAKGSGMHRFRLDTDGLFFPSVGGASTTSFAFEFIVPPNAVLTDLIVRNFRTSLEDVGMDVPGGTYASLADRDGAIRTGEMFGQFGVNAGGMKIADLDESEATVVRRGGEDAATLQSNNRLPGGWMINATSGTGGLQIDESNNITNGEHSFQMAQLEARGIDRKLAVDKFATTSDTGIIQVMVASRDKQSILGKAMQRAEETLPPLVLDSKGQAYECIGYVYSDGATVTIRFTPGRPIRMLSEAPRVSAQKRDQTLYLIFRPTKGAKIKSFVLGSKSIATYDPPVVVQSARR